MLMSTFTVVQSFSLKEHRSEIGAGELFSLWPVAIFSIDLQQSNVTLLLVFLAQNLNLKKKIYLSPSDAFWFTCKLPPDINGMVFCPPLFIGAFPCGSCMSELTDTFPEDHSVLPNILFLFSPIWEFSEKFHESIAFVLVFGTFSLSFLWASVSVDLFQIQFLKYKVHLSDSALHSRALWTVKCPQFGACRVKIVLSLTSPHS